MTYERLFHEDMTDLSILCNLCHLEYHKQYKTISKESTEYFINDKTIFRPKKKIKQKIRRKNNYKYLLNDEPKKYIRISTYKYEPFQRKKELLNMKLIDIYKGKNKTF
jgi:hypothetical protein